MSSLISSDHIVSLLEHHLAVNPDKVEISRQTAGDFGHCYWLKSDQGDFVLRLTCPETEQVLFYETGMMRREVELLKTLQGQISLLRPEVVVVDFSQRLIDRDFLIMESMPGAPYSEITSLSHAQHDRVYFQLGQYLKQLHTITGSTYGYDNVHLPAEAQLTWKEAFRQMWHRLIEDVRACGLYTEHEQISLIDLFDTYQAYFDRQILPVLLQMGIRKENMMVDRQGNLTGLLSFDLALWGDPEIEFAVLDCVGIWASAFWEGYGSPRPNNMASRTRRKFYILYEVQKNIPLSLKRRDDLEEAEQYKQTALTIASSLVMSES